MDHSTRGSDAAPWPVILCCWFHSPLRASSGRVAALQQKVRAVKSSHLISSSTPNIYKHFTASTSQLLLWLVLAQTCVLNFRKFNQGRIYTRDGKALGCAVERINPWVLVHWELKQEMGWWRKCMLACSCIPAFIVWLMKVGTSHALVTTRFTCTATFKDLWRTSILTKAYIHCICPSLMSTKNARPHIYQVKFQLQFPNPFQPHWYNTVAWDNPSHC